MMEAEKIRMVPIPLAITMAIKQFSIVTMSPQFFTVREECQQLKPGEIRGFLAIFQGAGSCGLKPDSYSVKNLKDWSPFCDA